MSAKFETGTLVFIQGRGYGRVHDTPDPANGYVAVKLDNGTVQNWPVADLYRVAEVDVKPKCRTCEHPLAMPESVAAGVCYACRGGYGGGVPIAPSVVAGVGPDAPTTTNAAGGKQSASPYRADLLPPHALLAVAAVLKHGADKYGPNNWHKIPVSDHINHALTHLYALGAGDASDKHLEHAATRILFALDQVRSGREAAVAAEAKKAGAA
jgi:hypothetical protein